MTRARGAARAAACLLCVSACSAFLSPHVPPRGSAGTRRRRASAERCGLLSSWDASTGSAAPQETRCLPRMSGAPRADSVPEWR